MSIRALPNNRLVSSPAYAKILHTYNEMWQTQGKVNNKKFFELHVQPEIPGYSIQAWYQFLKRFKTENGIIAATVATAETPVALPGKELAVTLLSNQDATAKGIALALNIGMDRLKAIFEKPELMTAKEAIDLLFKAMKAQDSRIHAVGKVREDNREEEKLNRTFTEASM